MQGQQDPASFNKRRRFVFFAVYSIMALLALAWSEYSDRNIFLYRMYGKQKDILFALIVGAGAGITIHLITNLFERFTVWYRLILREIKRLLGPIEFLDVLVFSMTSAIGEEMIFRGILVPETGLILSSTIFAILHLSTKKELWLWPVFAFFSGLILGWIFMFTGHLLAPIVAHFTVNYFGLSEIMNKEVL